MSLGDYIWRGFLALTCLFTVLAVTNILSMFPLNLFEFDSLPVKARDDITANARYRLAEYEERLAAHNMKLPDHDLMLHFNPQVCYNGEKAPLGTGPWPEEMTHYFCASKDLVDWCLQYGNIYQTTEHIYTLTNERKLHLSLTCYRVRSYYRYLDDANIFVCIVACLMVSFVAHSWWVSYQRSRGAYSEEPEAVEPSPPSSPPSQPPKKSGVRRDPTAPLPFLRSRQENYKKRR